MSFGRLPLRGDHVFLGTVTVGLLVGLLPGIFEIIAFLGRTLLHECGHAIAFWWAGIPAVPTFLFVTIPLRESAVWWMPLIMLGLGGVTIGIGRHRSDLALMIVGILHSAATVVVSYFLPASFAAQLVAWAGLGGELLVSSTVLALVAGGSFDIHGSRRHVLLLLSFIAALALSSASRRWIEVACFGAELPMGSFLGGEGHGDLNTLIDTYGWNRTQLTMSYLATMCAAWAVVFGGVLSSQPLVMTDD